MKELLRNRWVRVGLLTTTLFAINVIARVVVWKAAPKSATTQDRIGIISLVAIAVVMILAGFWWSRRCPIPRVVADLGLAGIVACLLVVLVGPFTGGSRPFKEGAGFFFHEIWVFMGLVIGGAFFGFLVATAFGLDWKSRQYKRHAEYLKSKPTRPIRR